MKYQLINPINPNYSTLEQILTNRGIKYEEINHYINTTDDDINSPLLLGEDVLREAATALISTISSSSKAALIVDADCDGFTSSALLVNYLYDIFPAWVSNNLDWYLHTGKQHGLTDLYDEIINKNYSLILQPDAGSNEYDIHEKLANNNIKIIILDHHLSDYVSPYAIVINNQLSDYPNKQLSGVGITWQFCRYLDSLLSKNYADQYLDLVALGNTADVMSLASIETKHLINKGFESENIHNPFIYNMWQKNKFKLGEHITSWGAAFYIAPFVNAVVRSGTQEDKEIVFKSMLNKEALKEIPSTKRGHELNETETIVEQAMRVCANVKNKQTKEMNKGVELLQSKIEDEHLLDNKVLLLLLEPNQIAPGIAGLIASRFASIYQRPCCILTKTIEDNEVIYQGSARGCDVIGIDNFKEICAETGLTEYQAGHKSAFGLALREKAVPAFLQATNISLKDMSNEPIYYVDYVYNGTNVNPRNILDIADMDIFWGKDVEASLIAIHALRVTKDMVTLMSPDKSPTLKIILPNKISIIKFGSSQEEYEKIATDGFVELDIIGEANKNEWNDNITPQIFIKDYEIIDSCKYYF